MTTRVAMPTTCTQIQKRKGWNLTFNQPYRQPQYTLSPRENLLDYLLIGVECLSEFAIYGGRHIMTNISGLSSSNIAAYSAPAQKTSAVPAAATHASPSTVSLLNSSTSSTPLTYNATGQLNASTQSTTSAMQAAQNAVLTTQNALTQTLSSLMSGSASGTSTTDMFGNTTDTNDPFAANTSTPGGITAQAAQSAYLATQNIITQSLNLIK
jgi:hypothetical protein